MYKLSVANQERKLSCETIIVSCAIMWTTDPIFYPQVKNKPSDLSRHMHLFLRSALSRTLINRWGGGVHISRVKIGCRKLGVRGKCHEKGLPYNTEIG
jgi:hypothetical protein